MKRLGKQDEAKSSYRRAVVVAALTLLANIVPLKAVAAAEEHTVPESEASDFAPALGTSPTPPPLDGTFGYPIRQQRFLDQASYSLPFGTSPARPPTPAKVISIPAGAHDSVEVDLTISQGGGRDYGSYGIRLHAAVTAPGGTPGNYDYVMNIFSNDVMGSANTIQTAKNVRLTWDVRIPREQEMDLHFFCDTIQSPPPAGDECIVSNIRGFADTGDWMPAAWNDPHKHAWGIYASSMPMAVVPGALPMTSDGPANPFLGMERSPEGYTVALRSPMVKLPAYGDATPLTASVRWQRAVPRTVLEPSCRVIFNFVVPNSAPRAFMALPAGLGSNWDTLTSPPFPVGLSEKSGFIEIQLEDCASGKPQAVGIDSLYFFLDGNKVDIPRVPNCQGRTPTIVGTDSGESLVGTDGADVILAGGGDDVITGSSSVGSFAPDTICGGEGNDVIAGGLGNDRIAGENGNDRLHGSGGNDLLSGGGDDDVIAADDGDDLLFGGSGNDDLNGSSGTDACDGGSGTNVETDCENTATLSYLIDNRKLEGFRSWAHQRSIADINREVAALDQARRAALAEMVLYHTVSPVDRQKLLGAMRTVLDHPDMGFYSEIWSYTRIFVVENAPDSRATCGRVWLSRTDFTNMPYPSSPTAPPDLLMHESLHSFNCIHGVLPGSFDEGSAIYVFKAAFPHNRSADENFAEAVYGTKLYYRDVLNEPDFPLDAPPVSATAKAVELYWWLSGRDGHHLPWTPTERLRECFSRYYKDLNRNGRDWQERLAYAHERMAQDDYCRPQ